MRGWSARDLADAAGTTVRTIHYYVAEGVLPPPEGQRRSAVYPDAHLARLRLVALLRDEGLSLAAIRARVSALDDAQAQAIAAELARLLAQEAEGISVLALFEAALTDLNAHPASGATTAATGTTARKAESYSYPDDGAERQGDARLLREGAGASADATEANGDGDEAPELDSATAYVERLLAARRHVLRPQRPSMPPPRPGAPRPTPRPQPMPMPMPMPPRPRPPFSGPLAPTLSLPLPLPVETWHTFALEEGIELRVRADRVHAVRDATAHADAATRIAQALDALRAALRGPDALDPAPTDPPFTSPTQADRRPPRTDSV